MPSNPRSEGQKKRWATSRAEKAAATSATHLALMQSASPISLPSTPALQIGDPLPSPTPRNSTQLLSLHQTNAPSRAQPPSNRRSEGQKNRWAKVRAAKAAAANSTQSGSPSPFGPSQPTAEEFSGSLGLKRKALLYPQDEEAHSLGPYTDKCTGCGALHWRCERPKRQRTSDYSTVAFRVCCEKGGVHLPHIFEVPPELENVLSADTIYHKRIRSQLRQLNNLLSFTSLGTNEQHIGSQGTGIYTFRIQGALYHRIGSLSPQDGDPKKFAQIYFHESDPEAMLSSRAQFGHGVDQDALARLQSMLLDVNPYVEAFQTASERFDYAQELGKQATLHILAPSATEGPDPRRYNVPTASEVAAIIIGDEPSTTCKDRHLVLSNRQEGLKIVSAFHPAYLPLRYPLLLPYGHGGWHPHIPFGRATSRLVFHPDEDVRDAISADELTWRKSKRVTQAEFYAYHIQDRDKFSSILNAGRLFQEFLVDAWAQIEQSRLWWIVDNQKTILRMDTHRAVQEAHASGRDLNDLGTVVMPNSFVNGPRWWRNLYRDAMAIVRTRGKPDLFITFTANPHWPEIKDALLPHQTPQDRPDIISRVFWRKLEHLEDLILHEGIFGTAAGLVRTCEFQKRGLPHAHLLVILEKGHKPVTPERVDQMVTAELPDPETHPDLFAVVMRNMVHGPCEPHHPCMNKNRAWTLPGQCGNSYPRSYQEKTTIDQDGYPTYRRRDDGRSFYRETDFKKSFPITNRNVVPYNPYLSTVLQAHVNVEVCTSIRAVKYLYKYVYKGPDRVTVAIEEEGSSVSQNEVKNYLDARYISASEASARILELSLHKRSPAVVLLPLHEEEEQPVIFDPDETNHDPAARSPSSKLLAFFALCADKKEKECAGKLTYSELLSEYTWEDRKWKRREKEMGTIGRINQAPQIGSNAYFLRLLLHIQKGPTSFADLKKVNGVPYPTFQAACSAAGLLQDDLEWERCLEEAALFQSAASMRRLFCMILVNNIVEDPAKLYDTFKDPLSDDCVHLLRNTGIRNASEERAQSYCRGLLKTILTEMGTTKTLQSLGINEPDEVFKHDHGPRTELSTESTAYDVQECTDKWNAAKESFNSDQLAAFDAVVNSCSLQDGATYFLDGPGGTGKTFVENAILSRVRAEGQIAIAVASSGIAALLLDGGRTAHSRFSIPINVDADSTCSIKKDSQQAVLLRNASLIIWDESPMAHRHAVEAVDRTLRDIRNDDRPFGGIVVLFSGDWRQTLPVIPKAGPGQIIASCLHRAPFWNNVRLLRLTKNQRLFMHAKSMSETEQASRRAYAEWLIRIGDGTEVNEADKIAIPQSLMVSPQTQDALTQAIYTDLPSAMTRNDSDKIDYFRERLILYPRNEGVNACNEQILSSLLGEKSQLLSSDHAQTDGGIRDPLYSEEFLNTIDFPGIPPHQLNLMPGVPVILLRNLDPKNGLCNGTRLLVRSVTRWLIVAKIMNGDPRFHGVEVMLPRIALCVKEGLLPFTMYRRQFPVRLAFALTINKAQGQSVSHVGVDVTTPVFSHGQLYVALSRATNPDNVKILCEDKVPRSTNIVYTNALQI